ncbi:MAG TPA: hypothetical protein VIP48_09885 [Streptosporangiaceae bacterium]|jgi:hypothetical protein
MAGLLLVGVIVVLIALYLAERYLKARAQARRLREMNDRLGAVTARVDQQQAKKHAQAQASAELTNVMPAINRPPLSLPGVPARGPARSKPSCERPGATDHGSGGRPAGRAGRRGERTGDHPLRASERHGA